MNWKPKPNELHFYFWKFLISSNRLSLIQFTPFKFLAQKLELIENKKHKLGKTRKYSSKNFIKGLPDNKLRFRPAICPLRPNCIHPNDLDALLEYYLHCKLSPEGTNQIPNVSYFEITFMNNFKP